MKRIEDATAEIKEAVTEVRKCRLNVLMTGGYCNPGSGQLRRLFGSKGGNFTVLRLIILLHESEQEKFPRN